MCDGNKLRKILYETCDIEELKKLIDQCKDEIYHNIDLDDVCYDVRGEAVQKEYSIKKQHDIYKLFLENGIYRNSWNTLLHVVAQFSHLDLLQEILEKGIIDVNVQDKYGKTPLHYATEHGQTEAMRLLLEFGANPNFKTDSGESPLRTAIFNTSNAEVAKILLEHGANRNEACTLISLAVRSRKYDQIKLLLKYCPDPKKIPLDFVLSYLDILRLLLEHGADPTAKPYETSHEKDTITHYALRYRYIYQAKILIKYLKDPNIRGENDDTLLHIASYYGDADIAKLLIDKGADVNAKNNKGRTPLHLAITAEVAELLIENGADVNVQDNDGMTPLHYILIEYNNIDPVRLLLQYGANPNIQDKRGNTALHYALWNYEYAKLLLEYGADPTIKNNKGKTPLDYLKTTLRYKPKILELLEKYNKSSQRVVTSVAERII